MNENTERAGQRALKDAVLRETDEAARRQAKSLMREARFAALSVLDPKSGAPLVSRVSTACDLDGAPIILISQLSEHFGALENDPRCALLMGEPGRGDPLAHPRITVKTLARKIEGDARARVRERFLRYHPKAALYADFGDFAFWRLELSGASLNGGFGKAYELDAEDVQTSVPEGFTEIEPGATAHMNEDHADAVALYAGTEGAWTLLGMDAEGLDLNLNETRKRVWYDTPLRTTEELRPKLVAWVKAAREK